jgi:hypothetical protein
MSLRRVVPFAAIAFLTVAVFAQNTLRPGKWEMTMTMEMAGMPGGMPPMTSTQCITKEQAADPQKALGQMPQRGGTQNDCKVDQKTVGNKMTFTMKCTTPTEMSGVGEITFGENTVEQTMKMTTSRGGQTMDMTMKSSGKRVGDCTQ